MSVAKENLIIWEKAEIKRSLAEAENKTNLDLKISEAIIQRYVSAHEKTSYPLEYIHYLLGDLSGKSVLDYGCGDAENSVLIAKRQPQKLFGIDISSELLNFAKQRMKLHKFDKMSLFAAASAHNLPFQDETFDVIFGKSILHHLDLDLAEKEIFRVLKKGGKALFLEPIRNSRLIKLIRQAIPYKNPEVSPFERPLTNQELNKFAERFVNVESREFSLPFVNLIKILPLGEKWIHKSISLDGKILRSLKFARKFATIRVFSITKGHQ